MRLVINLLIISNRYKMLFEHQKAGVMNSDAEASKISFDAVF